MALGGAARWAVRVLLPRGDAGFSSFLVRFSRNTEGELRRGRSEGASGPKSPMDGVS